VAEAYHQPVMLAEVLDAIEPKQGGVYVDCTVGGGGHSRAIADLIGEHGVVIGIDRDREALAEAEKTLAGSAARFMTFCAPFDEIGEILPALGFPEVDGILYDLGVSSHQLDDPKRGFTFRDEIAPLDMRMSQSEDTATAADLLNTCTVEELTTMLRVNADERWAARIAQFVGERRKAAPFMTAGELIETVKAAVPVAARSKDINPATKTFQALRIAVNDEFRRLSRSLVGAVECLVPGGTLVVISYHSGEDRIVKQTFSELAGKCICPPEQPVCICRAKNPSIDIVTRKPVGPTIQEIGNNPRARSAKLRLVRKKRD
jgi:16S rRNA (cytosine1402-N4)-methyltransferase